MSEREREEKREREREREDMKAENGRVFRDRKVDEHKRLDMLRNLNDVDDIRVRTRLKAQVKQGSKVLQNLRSLSSQSIETPSCKPVSKWYEAGELFEQKKHFVVPETYIRVAQERQKHVENGLEYDLDEEDESWLSDRKRSRGGCAVEEDDLENMLIRLEFALHATTRQQEMESSSEREDNKKRKAWCSVAESLPQESAIAILAANGFSHLVYQDLTLVYKYWVQKRNRAKKPILRCLQPPPALDETNPYDLFCGHSGKRTHHSSKHNKVKSKHYQEGGHSFWQPKPNMELTVPKALQHFKEDVPTCVTVVSGRLTGRLLEGLRHSEEYVSYHGRLMHPSEFERIGSGECHRNWKAALRVKENEKGELGPSVGEWLRIRGKQLGSTVLGKIVSLYNKKLNLFRSGIIEDFDRTNGQHLVKYLDGFEEEWLHLPMERVRWLPGSSVDFGIQVVKKVRKRTPVRSPRCTNIHKGGFFNSTGFFNSRKALQFQLATVQEWFHSLVQSARNFAARVQPVTVSPLKRGEFNGLAKLGSKKGKELLKLAPGYAKGKSFSEENGQNPEILPVLVGDLEGYLVSGCSQREDMVIFEGKEIKPVDFVLRSGVPLLSSWINLIQVNMKEDKPGPVVGDWLRARGHEVGITVVSKGLGVYRPEIGTFQWGNVVAFDRLSGKHLIQYEDGLREWLFLSLHFIKWVSSVTDQKKRKRTTGGGVSASKRLKFV